MTSYETLRSHAKTCRRPPVASTCWSATRRTAEKYKGRHADHRRPRRASMRPKVLLTGTPIQNDLGEFFAVMDFACPGLLGDASVFKKVFSTPWRASRDKHAPPRRNGSARRRARGARTDDREFVHRASARDVNAKHLPPKTEYVVFVRPSPVRAALYRAVLRRARETGRSRFGRFSSCRGCATVPRC